MVSTLVCACATAGAKRADGRSTYQRQRHRKGAFFIRFVTCASALSATLTGDYTVPERAQSPRATETRSSIGR